MREGRKFSLISFFSSFNNAFNGIKQSFREEHNIRVQAVIALIVLVLALLFQVSILEWLVLSLCIGLVISLELMNTAIERTVDLFCGNKYYDLAKFAKDAAAAAVFIASLTSLLIGFFIFLPRIYQFVITLF